MQTALQLVVNQSPKPQAQRPKSKDVRAQTLRAIHATWRKICPDLEGEELRAARIAFASRVLNIRKPLKSMSKLSPKQLGIVLDEMRRHERAPALPGVRALPARSTPEACVPNETAEIHHLATQAQVDTINKLIRYLNWSALGAQAFIVDKFKRHSSNMLTPPQANSCTVILFTIAARKRIKDRGFEGKISRTLIHAEFPALKRELGIDQKPSADYADYTEGETDGR
jgi:hypothetical protein